MALMFCKECGQQISDKAETCPHCGYRYRIGSVETLAEKRRRDEEKREAKKREIKEEHKQKQTTLAIVYCVIGFASFILFLVALEKAREIEWYLFWEYGYNSEDAMSVIMLFAICIGMDIGASIGYFIKKRRIENEEFQAIHSVPLVDKTGWWDCPKCGKENPPYCGTCDCGAQRSSSNEMHFRYIPDASQWWKCPRCGEENPASSRFCNCGESKPN